MKKIVIALSSVCLMFATAGILMAQTPAAPSLFTPTAADLEKAGFTQVSVMSTSNGRYVSPPYYFSVKEKVAKASEAPNIVLISVVKSSNPISSIDEMYSYGSESHSFALLSGQARETTMADDRIAINFITNNYYGVIIGPDKQKIENLASLISDKLAK